MPARCREGSALPKVTQPVVQQGGTRVHPELGSAGQCWAALLGVVVGVAGQGTGSTQGMRVRRPDRGCLYALVGSGQVWLRHCSLYSSQTFLRSLNIRDHECKVPSTEAGLSASMSHLNAHSLLLHTQLKA